MSREYRFDSSFKSSLVPLLVPVWYLKNIRCLSKTQKGRINRVFPLFSFLTILIYRYLSIPDCLQFVTCTSLFPLNIPIMLIEHKSCNSLIPVNWLDFEKEITLEFQYNSSRRLFGNLMNYVTNMIGRSTWKGYFKWTTVFIPLVVIGSEKTKYFYCSKVSGSRQYFNMQSMHII